MQPTNLENEQMKDETTTKPIWDLDFFQSSPYIENYVVVVSSFIYLVYVMCIFIGWWTDCVKIKIIYQSIYVTSQNYK